MTQEEKDILIGKLLDSPNSLTDNEINLILHNEELHETYDTSLLLKAAAISNKEYDLDEEWQMFIRNKHRSIHIGVPFQKWAAMILLTVSICAVAATISYRIIVPVDPKITEEFADEKQKKTLLQQNQKLKQRPEEIRLAETITFENKTFAEIAKQITAIFGCKIEIEESEIANLRLYLTLPKGCTVSKFVEIIDAYEALDASLKDQIITIKRQEVKQ